MTSPLLLAANTGPLSTLDIIFFLVFVVGVVALGIYQGEKAVQGEDGSGGAAGYFLSGRGLTWWLVGFSLIAVNISTEQFVGMSGAAADWLGMAIASYEWMAAIKLVVVAFVFHPAFGGIFNFIQEFQGFISPGILAVYLFRFLVPRTPRYAGWVGILLNVLLYGALKWFIAPELAFLNRMAICFGSVVAVLAVITWLRPMASPAVLPTTDLINLESSKGAKVGGIGVVLATLLLYALFW